MEYRERITIEPGTRSGKPCVRGERITVADVLEYLAGGMSVEDVLADFLDLAEEDVRPNESSPRRRGSRVGRPCCSTPG